MNRDEDSVRQKIEKTRETNDWEDDTSMIQDCNDEFIDKYIDMTIGR